MTFDANSWSAIGSIVNAAVVIVLAAINYLYLRAANRQAKAAEEQAKAALESLRLALRPHRLEVNRDQSVVYEGFVSVGNALGAIIANAETSSRWHGPVIPGNWTEVTRLFLSLYPDLYTEYAEFIEKVEATVISREQTLNRDLSGGYIYGEVTKQLLNYAVDAQERLKLIKKKMKALSPQSSAFLTL